MLKNVELKPITGTFVNMFITDTGISNSGLKEWEQDFRMLKALGMDSIFVIVTERDSQGVHISAEDPRSTTWPEDDNLLDMAFRLSDKYGLNLYLGGPLNLTNIYLGDWKKEVDENRRYYDRTVAKYEGHPCFKGLYVSIEALPWHFNFLDISCEVLAYMRKNFPNKATFMSPTFLGPLGDMKQIYTPDTWVEIYGKYFFRNVSGLLDYCAPQDKIAVPACQLGKIEDSGLNEWWSKAAALMKDCGIEPWANVESFQRPFPGHGEASGVFRQGDYRSLYMKLQSATPYVNKIITYDFFTCMSPNTEWGSSRRLLARYLEMIGKDTAIIDEIYGK